MSKQISYKNRKRALITGITGQDGSYLAELLLDKNYDVYGMVRRHSSGHGTLRNINHLLGKVTLRSGDLSDASSIFRIINEVKPDEIYNLAAQADVMESFYLPEMSVDINGNGVVRIIEAVRHLSPTTRIYQASTSELFGETNIIPQNETTPFNPQSPYSIGKFVGYQAIKKAREAYGLFACTGILFNHESERRGDDYVTRKVTKAVARIKLGLQKEVRLGNLEAKRDWGYAPEFVEAAHKIIRFDAPQDWVIGTGETHTVMEWVDEAFKVAGLNAADHVVIDEKYFRPAEVYVLQADYSKAWTTLGWEPRTKFHDLVRKMVNYDIENESRNLQVSSK